MKDKKSDLADKPGQIVTRIVLALVALFIVPLGPAALLVGSTRAATGVVIVAAFGCLAIGALIGFLFGLPRTSQRDSEEVRDNTNLEQVSDWLVKVLIGAGLVQTVEA